MKSITMMIAAAIVLAGIGSASAQEANVVTAVPNAAFDSFNAVVLFGRSDGILTGRSAFVDRSNTARVYGNGLDGQGVLAPGINGIF